MNDKLKYLTVFVAGAAIGSAATWFYLKTKYEKIIQEEIDSVKEHFSKKNNTPNSEITDKKEDATPKEEGVKVLHDLTDKLDYTTYSTADHKPIEERYVANSRPTDEPYVIAPEQFDEIDGYDIVSLTYYADGYLADYRNELVDDIDDTIGNDFASHFGEYEDDSVYIRNDSRRCDYEILMDARNYSDLGRSLMNYDEM